MTGVAAIHAFRDAVRADRCALSDFQQRYNTDRDEVQMSVRALLTDTVMRIGFQMAVVIRIMQLLRDLRVPLGGAMMSRLIRHLYGAEIHWEAKVAPGVVIVHGNGLVISRKAVVGPGCLLFQGVTLGESRDPVSGDHGAPVLGRNVHVMPNAVLIGPITVGDDCKIQPNVVLSQSVEARTSVCAPEPTLIQRTRGGSEVGNVA
jgi:serine O-acetyltransferase